MNSSYLEAEANAASSGSLYDPVTFFASIDSAQLEKMLCEEYKVRCSSEGGGWIGSWYFWAYDSYTPWANTENMDYDLYGYFERGNLKAEYISSEKFAKMASDRVIHELDATKGSLFVCDKSTEKCFAAFSSKDFVVEVNFPIELIHDLQSIKNTLISETESWRSDSEKCS
ncbi:MAG: hypothetical protein ACQES2_03500 [Pseudomonadota bacterium]